MVDIGLLMRPHLRGNTRLAFTEHQSRRIEMDRDHHQKVVWVKGKPALEAVSDKDGPTVLHPRPGEFRIKDRAKTKSPVEAKLVSEIVMQWHCYAQLQTDRRSYRIVSLGKRFPMNRIHENAHVHFICGYHRYHNVCAPCV